ncbi:MAG TPA: DUF58 domain-containing protein [Polyangiaceae bacterium]
MLPSRWLVLLLALPALAALGLFAAPELLRPLVAFDLSVAALCALDAVLSRRVVVTAERECPSVLAVGRAHRVRVVVRSRTSRRLTFELNDDGFEGMTIEGLPMRGELEPFGSVVVEYHARPTARGAFELGDLFVRYPSVLALLVRQARLSAKKRVRVYPDFEQVRGYELFARENRELSFVRAVRRPGGESEFSRLREYTKDDEYRSIDWKATARRQKLVAREYQLESNQTVLFALDAGRMMTAESQGLSQFDHALNASLMLAHVASRTGDQVGLLGFADRIRAFARPQGGKGATERLIRAAYDLHPTLVESDYQRALSYVALEQRKRALIILFTQVVDSSVVRALVEGTRGLVKRHLPLVVLFRDLDLDALLEMNDVRPRALYAKGAAAELWRFRQSFISDLRRAGALVLDAKPKELTSSLINTYLEVKARHLL